MTRLSADSDADGFYLIETSGLVIGQTAAITVARVDSNAGTGTADPVDGVQDDLTSAVI